LTVVLLIVGLFAINIAPPTALWQVTGVLALLVAMGLGVWWLGTRAQVAVPRVLAHPTLQRPLSYIGTTLERVFGWVVAVIAGTLTVGVHIVLWVLSVTVPLAVLYFLVRFVKWAWMQD
jgi:hypothetical protein